VELTSIITDATFSTATGTLTTGSTKGDVTAAKQQSAGIGGGAASSVTAEAIVVPQSAAFTLKVTVNNMDYTKKLTTKLEAGNNYVYPVTLNKQSLTVGSASIADWDNVEVEDAVSMRYQFYKTITNKADVQKYDYLMSDGKFMRVPSEYISDFISAKGKDIAGVVFWTKADKVGDCPDLTTDEELVKLGYTNGLVVSVNQYWTAWIGTVDFALGVTTYSLDALNGYSNTQKLKEYNNSEKCTYPVLAVSAIANEEKVTRTSGWYLPSPREGVYLLGGTTLSNDDYFTANTSEINKYLSNKIANSIWTSVEHSATSSYAVDNSMMPEIGAVGGLYKLETSYVRPICAF
jgi:hypothetical protein